MRRVLLAALVWGLMAGCADQDDQYCSALEAERSSLDRLADAAASRQPDYLADGRVLLGRMRETSPRELRDEWDTVYFAWADLVDALDDAGVDPRQFDPRRRPPEVAPKDFSRVRAVAAELASPRVRDAVRGINEHAGEACGVDLSL